MKTHPLALAPGGSGILLPDYVFGFITRKKDGKEHRYYSVVENVCLPGHRSPFQKTLLYLVKQSDAQRAAWTKSATVFDDATGQLKNLSLFVDNHFIPDDLATTALSKRIADYRLCGPRQNGTSKGGLCSEDFGSGTPQKSRDFEVWPQNKCPVSKVGLEATAKPGGSRNSFQRLDRRSSST